MKTAISIPDPLFQEAEQVAKSQGISRSELYSKAVEAFLDKLRSESITAKLNEVYEAEDSSLDPFWQQVQSVSLEKSEW